MLIILLQYATWDLAFHMIPFIHLDIEFAKKQLLLFLSDRYMHLSGQVNGFLFSEHQISGTVNRKLHYIVSSSILTFHYFSAASLRV